ncbi:hypothetical protein [Marinomonas algicola]|uniref:hypothetical protein n=1 Tax=Marinomonas algicola TaxID=2773454 RepID=UPI00174A08E8|nr:hypothetical protein [Marinomonas algicola]
MARKANISREEILLACWDLLEQNYYPNIPRVAEYFQKRDGRKCSNTTLLNSISEWEEQYKERQQVKFSDLGNALNPVFKKIEREFVQVLQSQLDEKVGEFEHSEQLKSDAVKGRYLSLSKSLATQADQLLNAEEKANLFEKKSHELMNDFQYMKQRYEDTLSTLSVSTESLRACEQQLKEIQLNLVQKEVDLVKIESRYSAIENENKRLMLELTMLKKDFDLLKQQNSELSNVNEQKVIDVLSAKIDSLNQGVRKKE